MKLESPPTWKRRRFSTVDPMDSELTKAKLAAAKEKFGREIRVFETSTPSSSSGDTSNMDESDEFYEFTAEDYYRLLAAKKEDKYLKTRKVREAEETARRARFTKAVIRVRFPDNYTLEAKFHPSETVQSLFDLLVKVVAHPEFAFYIYTTPPKKKITDVSQDFYSACFVPGAVVYFAYDLPKGDEGAMAAASGPYLHEEVRSLRGLEFITEQAEAEPTQPTQEPAVTSPAAVPERKPTDKKSVKPKWLKM